MPNKKISDLDSFDQLLDNEKFLITQSSTNKTSTIPVLGTKLNSDVGAAIPAYASRVASNLSTVKSSNATSSTLTTQDLTGAYTNLHVSPNATAAMFVYDTSRDSDGGAWTEKCQHTSWYNETLSGKWLGAVTGASLSACETAARAISGATTGDYYQASFDGKFYSLNSGSGTTEVFRGNKRDFPKLSAIVAETGNVTIYDLTEAGRPMWGRWGASSDWYINLAGSGGITSVSALQGNLVVGTSSRGFALFDFCKDTGLSGVGVPSRRLFPGFGLASVRTGLAFPTKLDTVNYVTLPSNTISAIAMTVLTDAPTDPVTGLKIPTIGFATASGPAVLRHDGVVKNPYVALSTNTVYFGSRGELIFHIGENGKNYRVSLAPYDTYYSFIDSPITPSAAIYPISSTIQYINKNRGAAMRTNTTTGVFFFRDNTSGPKSSAARIADKFNTGYMLGDIRRTYLSSAIASNLVGSLIIDGTFTYGISEWTNQNASSMTWTGSALRVTSDGSLWQKVYKIIPTTIGATYRIRASAAGPAADANSAFIEKSDDLGLTINRVNWTNSVDSTFVATATSTYIILHVYNRPSGEYADFDNVFVDALESDRSYKAATAAINGILTRSPVAPNAQLVAYSGFSTSNYIREAYSADLDFSTAEWSASAWVNIPTTLPVSSFPVIGSELIANGNFSNGSTGWTLGGTGWSISGNQAIAYNATGMLYQSGVFTSGKMYRIKFNQIYTSGSLQIRINGTQSVGYSSNLGTGTVTLYVYATTSGQIEFNATSLNAIIDDVSVVEIGNSTIFERSYSSGASINLGMDATGKLIAIVYDGLTTRMVTSPNAYNTATWSKVRINYTTDGTLALLVNGVQVASATGSALLTLNNSNAVLTIGANYGNSGVPTAAFPGSLALVKLSATVPTTEHSQWMYEQEKMMFQSGSQVCLPASTAVNDLSYDSKTDTWFVAQSGYVSEWKGLIRTAYRKPAASTYAKLASDSGIKLFARASGTVEIETPPIQLKNELSSAPTDSTINNQNISIFEFDSLASQTDFVLPVGYTTQAVYVAGVQTFEGATGSKFTRLFDGFRETIRLATAPSTGTWIKIKAARSV